MSFSGSRLRELRRQSGLSREALAVACDSSYPSIRFYENGLRQPSLSSAIKLAKALNCSLDDLCEVDHASAAG